MEWKDEAYTPSTSDNIQYEYGVWLVEATLNYSHSIDPSEDDVYVDPDSDFSFSTTLDFSVSSSEGFVSEANLYNLLDDLLDETENAAPMTNLEIEEVGSGLLGIGVSGFEVTSIQPTINPISGTTDRLAAIRGECDPSLPDGPSNKSFSTTNAAERINQAMGPYPYQHPNNPPPGWAMVGWYHTIRNHQVIENRGPQTYGYDWFSVYYTLDPVGQRTYHYSGTGQRQHAHLWGATEHYNNASSRNPYECLDNTQLTYWKEEAEDLAADEVATFGGTIMRVQLTAHDYVSGNPNPDYAYHTMNWTSGIYQQYGY